MNKIDWKRELCRKLCSRKLWFAIIGFVTGLMIYRGESAEKAEKLGALILQAASVLAYILGEGLADSGNHGQYTIVEDPEEDQEEVPPVPFVPPAEEDDGK